MNRLSAHAANNRGKQISLNNWDGDPDMIQWIVGATVCPKSKAAKDESALARVLGHSTEENIKIAH